MVSEESKNRMMNILLDCHEMLQGNLKRKVIFDIFIVFLLSIGLLFSNLFYPIRQNPIVIWLLIMNMNLFVLRIYKRMVSLSSCFSMGLSISLLIVFIVMPEEFFGPIESFVYIVLMTIIPPFLMTLPQKRDALLSNPLDPADFLTSRYVKIAQISCMHLLLSLFGSGALLIIDSIWNIFIFESFEMIIAKELMMFAFSLPIGYIISFKLVTPSDMRLYMQLVALNLMKEARGG